MSAFYQKMCSFKLFNSPTINLLAYLILYLQNHISKLASNPTLGNIKKAHIILSWKFLVNTNITKNISSSFIYRKDDYVKMISYFDSMNWKEIFGNLNINECYDIFLQV